jgi:hypothetical protein
MDNILTCIFFICVLILLFKIPWPTFFSLLITMTDHDSAHLKTCTENHLKNSSNWNSIDTSQNKHNLYIWTPTTTAPKRACIPIESLTKPTTQTAVTVAHTCISYTGSQAHNSWNNIHNSLAHSSWNNHFNSNE